MKDLDCIIAAVGGGGMVGGICVAAKVCGSVSVMSTVCCIYSHKSYKLWVLNESQGVPGLYLGRFSRCR